MVQLSRLCRSDQSPAWLSQTMNYRLLNQRQKYKGYRNYTEAGVDEDIHHFYSKGNQASILGDQGFRASIWKEHRKQDSEQLQKVLNGRPEADKVIAAVARVFNVKKVVVLTPQKGRKDSNLARKFAMYCCQQLADMPLKSIAAYFNLSHPGSVSWATHDVKAQLSDMADSESGACVSICLATRVSMFEEPCARKSHAGICAGGVE